MTGRLERVRRVFMYYLSWVVFGAVGLALNFGCMVLWLLPRRQQYGPRVRDTIRRLFGSWITWLRIARIIYVEWEGFGATPLEAGTIYVANHPTLIDATLLLARLPDAICIFKPALMTNPAVGPAAVMAGYVRGDTGLDLMKAAAAKVAEGHSLLVFPEGTRTAPGTRLGELKPGFALIADRARAPVRLLVIRVTPGLLTKGQPLWPAPTILPGKFTITLDRTWPYEPGRPATELTQAVERRICEVLDAAPLA